MAPTTSAHRKLFIHPAHRTVGVSGGYPVLKPYCWQESGASYSIYGMSDEPKNVAIVLCRQDAETRKRLELLEKIFCERQAARCERVEFKVLKAGASRYELDESDAIVCIGQGIQIAQHRLDIDVESLVKGSDGRGLSIFTGKQYEASSSTAEVEILAAFCGHPVLDGVGSFITRLDRFPSADILAEIPDDATRLLTGRSAGEHFPVAWTRYGCRGRIFDTLLGTAEDFGRSDFVRLTLNALNWVAV
jgi:hypothetical protein